VSDFERVTPPAGRLRAALAIAIILPVTLVGLPIQWLLWRLKLPGLRRVPIIFHRTVLYAIGARVKVEGKPVDGRPLLLLPNHVSWLDIPVIGSIHPCCFVAKAEIASWPVAGTMAKMQRSIFVDRSKRAKTPEVSAAMAERMAEGDPVVVFPEGTTGDGNRLLPFRSGLIGGVRDALGEAGDRLLLQPVSIAYARRDGLPIGRTYRAQVAWYGDMTLMPHLMGILTGGPLDITVTYGEPIRMSDAEDRKAMTKRVEDAVRLMTSAAVNGHRQPVKAGAEE
jgi:1-acyl-sn-glycerol-3-phosphate acyltransferase